MARTTMKALKAMKAKGGGAKGGKGGTKVKGGGGATDKGGTKVKGGTKAKGAGAKDKGKDTSTKVKEMGKNNGALRDKGNGKGKDEGGRRRMAFFFNTLSGDKILREFESSEFVRKLIDSLPIDRANFDPHHIRIMKEVPRWCKLSEAPIRHGENLYAVNTQGKFASYGAGLYINQDLFIKKTNDKETKEKETKEKESAEQHLTPLYGHSIAGLLLGRQRGMPHQLQ